MLTLKLVDRQRDPDFRAGERFEHAGLTKDHRDGVAVEDKILNFGLPESKSRGQDLAIVAVISDWCHLPFLSKVSETEPMRLRGLRDLI